MNDVAIIETGSDLVSMPKGAALLTVFTTDGAIDPLLNRIRAEIDAFEHDLSTATGRKAIASIAYRVAQSKTRIDDAGKELVAEQKKIPNKIDATRKRIRDTLDKWRDEVRQPLTDWENAEKDRIAKHQQVLTWFADLAKAEFMAGTVADLTTSLDAVRDVAIGEHCEEFAADYARGRDAAIAGLERAIAARIAHDAEQEELARLRAESAARAEKEREAAIAFAAAEQATKAAEARAAAEKAAADAETRRQAADLAAREADRNHRASVHRTALAAFTEHGIDDATSRRVIELIATRKIPNIVIAY